MKIIILVSCLFLNPFVQAFGQWYVKKYNVTDIKLLTREQLEESLGNSKRGLLYSGIVAGIGGIGMLAIKYGDPVPSEDPTFFEQVVGEKGMNALGTVFCAGLLAGGIISSFAYTGRIVRIKSIIRKNFPSVGNLDISPNLIFISHKESYQPVLTLTYNFR